MRFSTLGPHCCQFGAQGFDHLVELSYGMVLTCRGGFFFTVAAATSSRMRARRALSVAASRLMDIVCSHGPAVCGGQGASGLCVPRR